MQKMRHSHSRIHRCIFAPLHVLIWSIFVLCTHTVMIIIIKKTIIFLFGNTGCTAPLFFPPSVWFPSFPSFPFLWLSTRVPSHTRFFLFFPFYPPSLSFSHCLSRSLSLSVSPGHSWECGPGSLTGRDWGITEVVDRKSASATLFPALP